MKILVSSCLLGCKCRYDSNIQKPNDIHKLIEDNYIVPFCPEQAGGLETPRKPCEIVNNKVLNKDGEDKTEEFFLGANEALNICKLFNIEYAILKSNSPSCGYGNIYDGSFSGKLTNGNGITAELLSKNGVKILNEDNFKKFLHNK